MPRYIDAERIVEVAEHAYNEWNLANAAADGQRQINKVFKMMELCKAVKAIADDCPTIDAEPVRHGRWEQCFEDWRRQIEGDKCSACGFEHYGTCISHYHYCPNCGAKMDKEE